jgi:hypothetical protein
VELLERGFTVAEVAEIRRVDVTVVVEHALAAARTGRMAPSTAFEAGGFPETCAANLELLMELLAERAS